MAEWKLFVFETAVILMIIETVSHCMCYGLLLLNDTNCNKCLWMLTFRCDQFSIYLVCDIKVIRAVIQRTVGQRQIDDKWKRKDDRIYNLIFKLVEREVKSNQIGKNLFKTT